MVAPACNPAILLKIILYGYLREVSSSGKIAQCFQEKIDAARCGGEMPLPGGEAATEEKFSGTAFQQQVPIHLIKKNTCS